MEDHETLQSCAVISQLADAIQHQINDLLANGIMTTCVVIRSVLFARDNLLRMVQLAVCPSADFVAN